MDLSTQDVKKIAKLARLHLREDEVERFSKQLTGILSYVEQISELKTEGVAPTYLCTGLSNSFREDVVANHVLAKPDELLNTSSLPKDLHQIRIPRLLS